jgi:hypothetical protein
MHSPLFVSIYAFLVVFGFLFGVVLMIRMLGRIFGAKRPASRCNPTPEWRAPTDGRSADPVRRMPNFVPPPTPTTEQEYWQAEQYHFEHGLPAPLPPPRRDRDEW